MSKRKIVIAAFMATLTAALVVFRVTGGILELDAVRDTDIRLGYALTVAAIFFDAFLLVTFLIELRAALLCMTNREKRRYRPLFISHVCTLLCGAGACAAMRLPYAVSNEHFLYQFFKQLPLIVLLGYFIGLVLCVVFSVRYAYKNDEQQEIKTT